MTDIDWVDLSGDGGVLKSILKHSPLAQDSSASFPIDGEEVHINYTGRLLSGVEFDTNMLFGSAYSTTFDIVIGGGKMIRGMDVALKTMQVGEHAVFRFREDYAYGEEGSPARGTAPAIPSGATIDFQIELVGRSGAKGGLSADNAKKAAEDERRANIIAIREEKARQREEDKRRKEEEKNLKAKLKAEETVTTAEDVTTVFDARWAKSLKPNELKQELKSRGISIQGSKKDLLARLIADIAAKS